VKPDNAAPDQTEVL